MRDEKDNNIPILDEETLYEVYEVINYLNKQNNLDLITKIKKMRKLNIKGIVKDIEIEGRTKVIYIKDNNHRKGLKITVPKALFDKTVKISPEDQVKLKVKTRVKGEQIEFVLLELRKIRT